MLCTVRVQLGMQGIKVKMFTAAAAADAVQCPNPDSSHSLYKGLCDWPESSDQQYPAVH